MKDVVYICRMRNENGHSVAQLDVQELGFSTSYSCSALFYVSPLVPVLSPNLCSVFFCCELFRLFFCFFLKLSSLLSSISSLLIDWGRLSQARQTIVYF